MGKLTPGLSVEARANRESRMLRQVCAASPSDEITPTGSRGPKEMTSGSTADSRPKGQQDNSMPIKREVPEDV